jgi:hypothetical protein
VTSLSGTDMTFRCDRARIVAAGRTENEQRMRTTTTVGLALTLALIACSQGTGILPAGPDTYTVTEHRAPVLGGAAEAQRVAMTEANDYCAQSGKEFFPLNMAGQAAVPAGGPGYWGHHTICSKSYAKRLSDCGYLSGCF